LLGTALKSRSARLGHLKELGVETSNREFRDAGRRGLPLSVEIDGAHVVIRLRGEIDVSNADLLLPAAVGAVAGDDSLRLDLADVTFLDVGALRQLLICEACLARDGVDVKLRNVPAHIRQVLEHAQLAHLIESNLLDPAAS
jgi:anti-anti-sigma factor